MVVTLGLGIRRPPRPIEGLQLVALAAAAVMTVLLALGLDAAGRRWTGRM